MTSASSHPRTRVVLRIAGGPGPAYLAAAADWVLADAGSEVVLVLRASTSDAQSGAHPTRWLAAAYERLERAVLRGGMPAVRPYRMAEVPGDIAIVTVDDPGAADALAAARPDVLIDLAGDAPGLLEAAVPLERWRIAVALGLDTVGDVRLTRPSTDAALARSWLAIDLPGGDGIGAELGIGTVRRIGFARDRDAIYWRAAKLPARQLARLAAGSATGRLPRSRPDSLGSAIEVSSPDPFSAQRPSRLPPLLGLARTIIRKAADRAVYSHTWRVLVRTRAAAGEVGAWPADMTGFALIPAPPGRFYADPFLVETDAGPRLYVEDCPKGLHRGRISTLRPDDEGGWTLDRIVLEDLPHRAYPHAIVTPDGIVVTPDGGGSDGVDIFVDRGGAGLERIAHILEGRAASDPTLLWRDGRYWLFVTITGQGMSPADELHLFSAARLTDPWHPHPRNPIVADVRRARSAGRVVECDGRLLRPGQDCSVAYGARIVLSAITTLSRSDYEEHPIATIEPHGVTGIDRVHTFTFAGAFQALDGYERRRMLARRITGGQ